MYRSSMGMTTKVMTIFLMMSNTNTKARTRGVASWYLSMILPNIGSRLRVRLRVRLLMKTFLLRIKAAYNEDADADADEDDD
jgi:hypothetical protein